MMRRCLPSGEVRQHALAQTSPRHRGFCTLYCKVQGTWYSCRVRTCQTFPAVVEPATTMAAPPSLHGTTFLHPFSHEQPLKNSVCLVVPCVPRHVQFLPELLATADAQSRRAAQVVLALSETEADTCAEVATRLRISTTPLSLSCVPWPAYAAANRNRGASLCREDFISFMDADDLMMGTRLEEVVALLVRTQAHVALHAFDPTSCCKRRQLSAATMRKAHEAQKMAAGPIHLELPFRIHHGHPTVRRSTFEAAKLNESAVWRRGQDCEYLRRLLDLGFDLVASDARLVEYRIELSAGVSAYGAPPPRSRLRSLPPPPPPPPPLHTMPVSMGSGYGGVSLTGRQFEQSSSGGAEQRLAPLAAETATAREPPIIQSRLPPAPLMALTARVTRPSLPPRHFGGLPYRGQPHTSVRAAAPPPASPPPRLTAPSLSSSSPSPLPPPRPTAAQSPPPLARRHAPSSSLAPAWASPPHGHGHAHDVSRTSTASHLPAPTHTAPLRTLSGMGSMRQTCAASEQGMMMADGTACQDKEIG